MKRSWILAAALVAAASPSFAQNARSAEGAPIAGAPGWLLQKKLPGYSGPACTARRDGSQIDTMLVLNDGGKLLLMAGRADWNSQGATAQVKLSLDGGEPISLEGTAIINLLITQIEDEAMVQRLRDAHAFDWTLPNGRYHTEVGGLGIALDAIKACMAELGPRPKPAA